ncbi:MAG: thiamine pyrophosphate-dependent enzyme, partial [bacterium]
NAYSNRGGLAILYGNLGPEGAVVKTAAMEPAMLKHRGAAIGCPDRIVFCITGDGGIQMTSFELATLVEHRVPVKIAIANNGYLGMVRQWQELFFGGRYSHSCLKPGNPDFVKLAESYGAIGLKAEKPDEVLPVLKESIKIKDKPVVMNFKVANEENVYPMVPAGASLYEMVEGED